MRKEDCTATFLGREATEDMLPESIVSAPLWRSPKKIAPPWIRAEGLPIPFAELGGDPFFAKTARTTATALGLNLRPIIQVESFSLLMSAVESGTAAAFIPTVAARSLPEQHFAQVSAKAMQEMQRSLSLVWYAKSAESRAPVRRAVARLKRALV